MRIEHKMNWSKKDGLNLIFDKTRILKQELETKGCASAEIPPNPQPLIHKGNDNYLKHNRKTIE